MDVVREMNGIMTDSVTPATDLLNMVRQRKVTLPEAQLFYNGWRRASYNRDLGVEAAAEAAYMRSFE